MSVQQKIAENISIIDYLRQSQLQKGAQEAGVSFSQFPILNYVKEHPGCTQKDVADTIRVTPASIALSSKKLQALGLLNKVVDTHDLRCNKLYLTEAGTAYMEEWASRFLKLDQAAFSGITEKEATRLLELLEKVRANLEKRY